MVKSSRLTAEDALLLQSVHEFTPAMNAANQWDFRIRCLDRVLTPLQYKDKDKIAGYNHRLRQQLKL